MRELKARDVMSTRVVTVSSKTLVVEAAKLMLANRISGLPVVDDFGRLVGIVSEADLLRRPEIGTQVVDCGEFGSELASQFPKSCGQYVGDVMTTKVASVLGSTPLAAIADLLETMRLKRVPVIEDGKVVGVVSRADLLRAFVNEIEISATRTGHRGIMDRSPGLKTLAVY